MPSKKPRSKALAILFAAALGVLTAAPSFADEPALPQFDPDSVVKLENGLNWVDLNGDGIDDLVVRSSFHGVSSGSDFFDFSIVDRSPYLENGEELSHVKHPGLIAQAGDDITEYAGELCHNRSLRLVRRQGQTTGALTVVVSHLVSTDEAFARCAAMPVEFKIYELEAVPPLETGPPFQYSYELKATYQSRDWYVESYMALEELGLH